MSLPQHKEREQVNLQNFFGISTISSDDVRSWIHPVRHERGISIVYVDLTPDEIREQHALMWLNPDELERWNRFRVDRPKREFALCRAALRYLLCLQLGCENSQLCFGLAKYGKPFALVNGKPVNVRFNVTHSDPHGLITITQGVRVGIDVEQSSRKRDFDGIASMVFGPNEQAEIASLSGEEKARLFFRFWTLKEALVKALGTGLSMKLTEVEISPEIRRGAQRGIFQFPEMPETSWALEDLSTPEYSAAIASEILSSESTSI